MDQDTCKVKIKEFGPKNAMDLIVDMNKSKNHDDAQWDNETLFKDLSEFCTSKGSLYRESNTDRMQFKIFSYIT